MPQAPSQNGNAAEFERRVRDAFQSLGYTVKEPTEKQHIDFLAVKSEPLFDVGIGIELKFYRDDLVSSATIRRALALFDEVDTDKMGIVTTLGFSPAAKESATGLGKGKLILATESELLSLLPRGRHRRNLLSAAAESYLSAHLARTFEPRRLFQEYASATSGKRFLQDLLESADTEKIIDVLIKNAPAETLVTQLLGALPQSEREKLIRDAIPRTPVPAGKKEELKKAFEKAKAATEANEKGKLLEEVAKGIFSLVPDLEVVGSNIDTHIEEIDLQVRNRYKQHVWNEFGGIIFVESKNWSKRVGAAEIRDFQGKLDNHNLKAGIVIAVNGVTGKGPDGAWGQIKKLLLRGYTIIVLEGTDIDAICECDDVSEVVDAKFNRLYQLPG